MTIEDRVRQALAHKAQALPDPMSIGRVGSSPVLRRDETIRTPLQRRRPARAFGIGFAAALAIGLVGVIAAVNHPSLRPEGVGAPASPHSPSTPAPSPATSTTTLTTSTSTSPPELSAEFLAAVLPIDGPELYAARATVGASRSHRQFAFLADCLEEIGYSEIVDATRNLSHVYNNIDEVWRFPDLTRLADQGFDKVDGGTVEDLWFSSMGNPEKNLVGVDPATHLLSLHPEWGVSSDQRDTVVADMAGCIDRFGDSEQPPVLDQMMRTSSQWWAELDRIDTDPAIAELSDEVTACLREVDPRFADARDPQHWLTLQSGADITMDTDSTFDRDEYHRLLVEWGRGYGECVEPVVAARVELRLRARQTWVRDNFTELLDMQDQLIDALSP